MCMMRFTATHDATAEPMHVISSDRLERVTKKGAKDWLLRLHNIANRCMQFCTLHSRYKSTNRVVGSMASVTGARVASVREATNSSVLAYPRLIQHAGCTQAMTHNASRHDTGLQT